MKHTTKDIKTFTTQWGGKELTIEHGRFADQATAALVKYGETMVLATVVMSDVAREGTDFVPLMVDYEERLYAAGKIKGSRFIKREGRPSDEAILTARLVDRSIRPLFPKNLRNDVQVVLTVLSWDNENDPDIVSLIAASTALVISPVPWAGPIAAARIGQIDGEWVLNPSYDARAKSSLDLVVAGFPDKALMIEASAHEVSEETVLGALDFARSHLTNAMTLIHKVKDAVGKEKINFDAEVDAQTQAQERALREKIVQALGDRLDSITAFPAGTSKDARRDIVRKVKDEVDAQLKADNEVSKEERARASDIIRTLIEERARTLILKEARRVDGRKIDEIRPLTVEVGLLPRTHGSGSFRRGETEALSIVTLGAPSLEQTLDTMEEEGKKHYMHHYNFPGFSTGEVKPIRSPGRREIGHGALAEKALLPVLPTRELFPYTIRVVSEILSSNGSTSMAATCGSTLALMDAGVPISAPVAGIAMGLVIHTEDEGSWKVLTDIQGVEDFGGDMDFKVAGTKKGITVIQLDMKVKGITTPIVKEALMGAHTARLHILSKIEEVISSPRDHLSQYAPKIMSIRIPVEKIREVIGPGGKMIHEIIEKTGATVDIEQDGLVFCTSTSQESVDKAVEWIKNLTREVTVGEMFQGKVTRILDFGAFVEILPKHEGLVHISEFADFRINRVEDAVEIGQTVPVKVIGIDELGRINLSVKQADPTFVKESAGSSSNGSHDRGQGDRRHHDRRGGERRYRG